MAVAGNVSIHARTRRATTSTPASMSTPDLVSIHARTRRATLPADLTAAADLNVSIHARTRRATWSAAPSCRAHTSFNPRPHAAGDPPCARQSTPAPCVVSIHARTRRATIGMLALDGRAMFQSTPARGGRPRRESDSDVGLVMVSIHARTRRATSRQTKRGASTSVSIHARTRRATAFLPASWPALKHGRFNPRPHAAGDGSYHAAQLRCKMFQSTPARGGRRSMTARPRTAREGFNPRPHAAGDGSRSAAYARLQRFNPRPHAAGDGLSAAPCTTSQQFQSTPARGGRHAGRGHGSRDGPRFNPRPHAAGDRTRARPYSLGADVSIHARTRRATVGPLAVAAAGAVFQSTPARGGRRSGDAPIAALHRCFNPRPHAAGDAGRRAWQLPTSSVSIHARTRRATCSDLHRPRCSRRVSIHARTRRATRRTYAAVDEAP